MKLAAKYDIEAPVEFVYRELTDFDAWERMAMRRGAEVSRADNLPRPGPGMAWLVNFAFRGKLRSARLQLGATTPTSNLSLSAQSALVDGELQFDLLDLATTRTRIEVRLDAKPKTLAAKLYVQTLRLARKKVERSFAQRVAQLAVEMEDRYRRPTSRKL